MADDTTLFTSSFNFSPPLPFPTSPHSEEAPMCVITDLFDISEEDWFSSRLDKSPSRNSSLSDPENTLPPADAKSSTEEEEQHSMKDIQIEAVTPEADSPETSFNLLTTQSEHHFQESLATNFNTDLPLDTSASLQLTNDLPLEHDPTFGNQDLLKYTNLQDEQPKQQNHHISPSKPPDHQLNLDTTAELQTIEEDAFPATETTPSIEPQSIEQILQSVHHPLKLDDEQAIDLENDIPKVLTTVTTETDDISFDEFYRAISVNGHPLPDVHTYIAALAGTTPVADEETYEETKPKPRRKRKLSKREAARAASAAEMAREEELAMLAKTKQITDDELLRLKPKKQRRAARFDKPVPSRFCHVCSRTPKNVRLVVCCKIKKGICRKVICEKCFEEYQWGDFQEALQTDSSDWICPHCSGKCPERAQCRTYQRINDRLRVNRLKQEGPRNGRRRIKRQMEQHIDGGDEKRPRFLLPATIPGEFEGFDAANMELEIDGMGNDEGEAKEGC